MPKIPRTYVEQSEGQTVAQLLLRYLVLEGVEYVFGVPGGSLMNLLKEFKAQRDRFTYVVCRHETGAAYMADGYYRVTGNLGVVMVTSGPGATNALTGTMSAQDAGSALLTITGEVNEGYYGKGSLQEGIDAQLDVAAIYAAATAYSTVISNKSDFQTLFAQALRDSRSIPQRASHVSMPNNISEENVDTVTMPTRVENYRATPQGAPLPQVKQALEALWGAKRPLIFLGNGCREALHEENTRNLLVDFVERYGIPVMTTADGKGVFPESHDLSLRTYGIAGCNWPYYWLNPEAPDAPPYDALLVLGSELGELSTNKWNPMLIPSGPFIQVDLNQRVIARAFHVSLGIVGEVGAFIRGLAQLAPEFPPDDRAVGERKKLVAEIKDTYSPFDDPEQYDSVKGPIEPAALVRVLQQTLPNDSIILLDAGNCVGWGAHYFTIDAPREIHGSLGMGPMGFAVGAVVGARIGQPDRTCLALVGDGAFMMQGAEVSTAKAYEVGAIWVVLYDDDLHMVSQGMAHFCPDEKDPDVWSDLYRLGNPNLVDYAKGLGADAYEIHTPDELERIMPTVLERANGEHRPQVVIAHIERGSQPPYYDTLYHPPQDRQDEPRRNVK